MQLKNLTMSFGMRLLFKDVSLHIGDKQKVGIVGVNGAGKTTFFKILMGLILPDEGKVIFEKGARVEWLPQVIDEGISLGEITVLDFLLLGRPIQKLEIELKKLYAEVADEGNINKQKKILRKIDEIQSQLDYWEVYSAENTLLQIINGMNISNELLSQELKTLSGGQKSKIAFAKLLYSKPELILLDEPTNHLDEESREYVINYLKNYKGSVYIISHDIDFLNEVTNQTLFLDNRTQTMELYNGNYNVFKKLNIEYEKSLNRQIQIQEENEKKLKVFIDKYSSASGKRKKMVQDREKKLAKLRNEKIEVVGIDKKIKLNLEIMRESSNFPLRVKNLTFRYDKNKHENIIDNLTFDLNKGEKFLIVGPNGIGKSTLLKLIIGELKPDNGQIIINDKTDIGYYAQEHELLDNNKNIIDNFLEIDISDKKLRAFLGGFLFHGDDVFKKVDILSPGERSRVALAKLALQGSNLLILDEPTNHLDPETQKVIAQTFKNFPGTMLIVSHNPEFVDNLGVERTLVLPTGKISYYKKDIIDYYEKINSI